jgi:hypothetical protein
MISHGATEYRRVRAQTHVSRQRRIPMWQARPVPVLAVWATPRTVSTAFERMMIERCDHLVLDEPWSRAYHFGPERRSDRSHLTFPESTYAAVEAGFTDDEAGSEAQRVLFDRVCDVTGSTPPVIDSDALRADPDRVVASWCEQVGIDHRPESLRWETGMQPEWQLWRSWYENAAASTGFAPPSPAPLDDEDLPPRIAELLPAAERAVESLQAHAIDPIPDQGHGLRDDTLHARCTRGWATRTSRRSRSGRLPTASTSDR